MTIYGFIKERCEHSHHLLKSNTSNERLDSETNKVHDKNQLP